MLVSTCCRKGSGAAAAEREAPHVDDVEEARRAARGEVLGDDARGVLEGHLPAAEVDHAGAERHMPVVERRALRARLRAAPARSCLGPRFEPAEALFDLGAR